MAVCERLKECGFFKKYKNSYESTCAALIEEYCNNIEKSNSCERKRIFNETGASPDDDMMPNGKMVDEL